jgi:DNA polymerase alpha subunit A
LIIKVVRRNYAFDKRLSDAETDIPYETDYLQVEYVVANQDKTSGSHQLPSDLSGDTFSTVFGTHTSYLEHLLIETKMKGPCWLLSSSAKRRDTTEFSGSGATLSWCKLEYLIDNFRSLSVYHDSFFVDRPDVNIPPSPPLTQLTLLTRTMLNSNTQEHEVVCACGLVSNRFYLEKATAASTKDDNSGPPMYDSYFCALTKPKGMAFPFDLKAKLQDIQKNFKIQVCDTERELLSFFLSKIQTLDVDIIVGHDLFGFNLDIILNRININKVPLWSRIGRLKRSNYITSGSGSNHSNHKNANSQISNLITQQRIQTACSGRLLCDVMLSAKELLTKCKSFELNELVSHCLYSPQLNKPTPIMPSRDYEEEKNVAAYYTSSQLLLKYLQLLMTDATYILRICNDLQCLQLAYQITCIAGNVLSRTLVGGRSERNEFLLLHAFKDKNFILPDKQQYGAGLPKKPIKSSQTKVKSEQTIKTETNIDDTEMDEDELISSMVMNTQNKSQVVANKTTAAVSSSTKGYAGGLVLEPRIGFYDRFILLLDFNSLYPSIIQEYNICFTTIARPSNDLADVDLDEYLETCIKLPGEDEKPGILPMEIKKLVNSRRQVKQLMQDRNLSPDLRTQYDIRQKALKLTANSVYGCLGFENSRFFCKPLAALITKFGRNILMKTKELVESKKIEVIYGDTDSIMINTNLIDYDAVMKMGQSIKAEVNKHYKHLEIDIDGVFKSLLLLRKKKYAALTIVGRNPKDPTELITEQEIKGLDVVRRDWCLLAKAIGEKVIGEILSGHSCDTVITNVNKILTDTAEKIKNNTINIKMYEISKQLARNPEDYNDAVHQSHVQVALRHNKDKSNSKKYKSGNVIAYIICEDGTTNSAVQRAYSTSEYSRAIANPNPDKPLKLDTNYYLTQQLHPVVTRLCEPIEGIDAVHIAEALGLDPTAFRHKKSNNNGSGPLSIAPAHLTKQQKKLENYMNELGRFSNCTPFKYKCPECKTESLWQSPFVKIETDKTVTVKEEPKDEDDIEIDSSIIITDKKATSTVTNNDKFKSILTACSNVNCKLSPIEKLPFIKNSLTLQLNKFIKDYYQVFLFNFDDDDDDK